MVMSGGSGIDTFALISDATASSNGSSMTKIQDLASGDQIDLSFLEKAGDIDFTSANTLSAGINGTLYGKATLVDGSFALNLGGFIVSNDNGNAADANSTLSNANNLASELLVVGSNATKVSAAISAAFGVK